MPVTTPTQAGSGDILPSLLRTFVPVLVGLILGVAGANFVGVTEESLTAAVSTAITLVYYLVLRLVEQKWPKFGILLGSMRQPTYNGNTQKGG
jgi:hypothetical protein